MTAYLDGSQVYGSTPQEETELREFSQGLLKVGPGQESVPGGVCPSVCPLSSLPVRQDSNGDNEFFAGNFTFLVRQFIFYFYIFFKSYYIYFVLICLKTLNIER